MMTAAFIGGVDNTGKIDVVTIRSQLTYIMEDKELLHS